MWRRLQLCWCLVLITCCAIVHATGPHARRTDFGDREVQESTVQALNFYRKLLELSSRGDSKGIRALCDESDDYLRCSNKLFDFRKLASEIDGTRRVKLDRKSTVYDYILNGGVLPDNLKDSTDALDRLHKWQMKSGANSDNINAQFGQIFKAFEGVVTELSDGDIPIKLSSDEESLIVVEEKEEEADEGDNDKEKVEEEADNDKEEEDNESNNSVVLRKRGLLNPLKAVAVGIARFFGVVVGSVVLAASLILFVASTIVGAIFYGVSLIVKYAIKGTTFLLGCALCTIDCITCFCCLPPFGSRTYYKIKGPMNSVARGASDLIREPVPMVMFTIFESTAKIGFWLVGSGEGSRMFSTYQWQRDRFLRNKPSSLYDTQVLQDTD